MKIIFYSNRDNKLAKWVASNYFDLATKEELNNKIREIFLRDRKCLKDNLCCMGKINSSSQVIALGCYGQEHIIINLITGLNNLFAINEKIILINIDALYNISINLGLLAINLRLEKLGLLLIEKGIVSEMSKIEEVIKKTKERITKV